MKRLYDMLHQLLQIRPTQELYIQNKLRTPKNNKGVSIESLIYNKYKALKKPKRVCKINKLRVNSNKKFKIFSKKVLTEGEKSSNIKRYLINVKT